MQSTSRKFQLRLRYAFVTLAIILSGKLYAEQQTDSVNIPYLEDAKVFAEFTDKLPAVINYFTQHNRQEIIDFYQQKYGEATRSEMKRGRLTLYFNLDQHQLRVVISPQNNRQQVDILLNK